MTWYYVPSTCAPATEGSSLPCDSPASHPEPWLTSSGTPTQRPLSWRGWRTRPWIRLLSGLTSPPSTLSRGVAGWISSLPVSPASRSPRPASAVVLMTSDGCGHTLPGSSLTWDRDSSSWRTCPDLVRLGLPHVLADLAELGFDAEWGLLSAADVGASHRRERFWLLAHADGEHGDGVHEWIESGHMATDLERVRQGKRPVLHQGRPRPSTWPTPTASDHEGNGMRSGERSDEPKLAGRVAHVGDADAPATRRTTSPRRRTWR